MEVVYARVIRSTTITIGSARLMLGRLSLWCALWVFFYWDFSVRQCHFIPMMLSHACCLWAEETLWSDFQVHLKISVNIWSFYFWPFENIREWIGIEAYVRVKYSSKYNYKRQFWESKLIICIGLLCRWPEYKYKVTIIIQRSYFYPHLRAHFLVGRRRDKEECFVLLLDGREWIKKGRTDRVEGSWKSRSK